MANQQYRILIKSIGTAKPAASVAVASGLGLPAATVVSRLYSAPAILIDGIDEHIARGMVKLLNGIGFEAEAQDTTLPVPAASPLYDVAIYIKNARQYQHVIQTVAEFTGIVEDDATRMILSPPGVILGSVGKAAVDALSERLGPEVSVLSSQADTARYNLFLSEDTGATIHRRILQNLSHDELELCGTSGLIATNVDHATARELWQRHQSSGLLRIVNQDFLRFDLVLQTVVTTNVMTPEQMEALEKLAGIPSDMVEQVLQAAPITLLESVPGTELAQPMAAFAEVDLDVRADMITFQMLGLEILSLSDRASTVQSLESFGLHQQGKPLPRTPFSLPGVMPELKARIIRAALEDTGAEVTFMEVC